MSEKTVSIIDEMWFPYNSDVKINPSHIIDTSKFNHIGIDTFWGPITHQTLDLRNTTPVIPKKLTSPWVDDV